MVAYYFSTIVIYMADIVIIAIEGPFKSDIFSGINVFHFITLMSIYLLILCLLGVFWVKSMFFDPGQWHRLNKLMAQIFRT